MTASFSDSYCEVRRKNIELPKEHLELHLPRNHYYPAWSDAAAAENASIALVNDLTLHVQTTTPTGACRTYMGNAIGSNDLSVDGTCLATPVADSRNNVELIVFQGYVGQTFTVKVSPRTIAGKADLTKTTNNQDFGLYVYNAR